MSLNVHRRPKAFPAFRCQQAIKKGAVLKNDFNKNLDFKLALARRAFLSACLLACLARFANPINGKSFLVGQQHHQISKQIKQTTKQTTKQRLHNAWVVPSDGRTLDQNAMVS